MISNTIKFGLSSIRHTIKIFLVRCSFINSLNLFSKKDKLKIRTLIKIKKLKDTFLFIIILTKNYKEKYYYI